MHLEINSLCLEDVTLKNSLNVPLNCCNAQYKIKILTKEHLSVYINYLALKDAQKKLQNALEK